MKKILALCLSIVMLLSVSTTAFAAEYWDESAGSGETEVYAHIYSSYSISIPATIDLRNGEQGAVTLTEANIESGYEVNVYCTNIEDGGIRLHHVDNENNGITVVLMTEDKLYNYTADTPIASFVQSEITSESLTKYFAMEIMDKWNTAGDYVGVMEYSFECSPIED